MRILSQASVIIEPLCYMTLQLINDDDSQHTQLYMTLTITSPTCNYRIK